MSTIQGDIITNAAGSGPPNCTSGIRGSTGRFNTLSNSAGSGPPDCPNGITSSSSVGFDTITDAAGTGAPNLPNGLTVPVTALGTVYSATYTPTIADGGAAVTLNSIAANLSFYYRIGNLVTVAGVFNAGTSLGVGQYSGTISIPLGANFGSIAQASGVVTTLTGTAIETSRALADTGSAQIFFSGFATDTATRTFSFSFTYQVQ